MGSFVRGGRVVLLALLLAACGAPASSATSVPPANTTPVTTPTSKLIEPGDTVGDVTLVTNPAPAQASTSLTDFCLGYTVRKPGIYDFKCPSSVGSMHMLGMGWSEETAKALEDSWSRMKWRAYLDGHEIDLKSFGTFDSTVGNYVIRAWNVAIKDVTPREYTLRTVFEVQQALTASDPVYPVGTYDITNHVTVLKPVK